MANETDYTVMDTPGVDCFDTVLICGANFETLRPNGANHAGSGFVFDLSPARRRGGIVTATLIAPNCRTAAVRDAIARKHFGTTLVGDRAPFD